MATLRRVLWLRRGTWTRTELPHFAEVASTERFDEARRPIVLGMDELSLDENGREVFLR